jgi:hypothetical protein
MQVHHQTQGSHHDLQVEVLVVDIAEEDIVVVEDLVDIAVVEDLHKNVVVVVEALVGTGRLDRIACVQAES